MAKSAVIVAKAGLMDRRINLHLAMSRVTEWIESLAALRMIYEVTRNTTKQEFSFLRFRLGRSG
jgi:hypothetical protein